MLKQRRAAADAVCGGPPTLYQRIAGVVAPVMLLGVLIYIGIVWHALPERVPSNYNFAGEITGYSGRGLLLVMPLIGLVNDLILWIVGFFPQSWNTGVRVTVLNRTRVYRLLRDLMADLRLACALLFGGFAVYQSLQPERFSGNVTGVMLLLVLVPLVRYFVRLRLRH